MPIEIKELHIHVVVNAASGGQAAAKPQQAGTGESNSGGSGGGDKDTIIAECVEQVLDILQNKRER